MRACPRCSIPLSAHSRAFAEIDVCSQCGGAFLDAGEGVMVHGAGAEPAMLAEDGRAQRTGTGALRCPADHARMETWEVGADGETIEVDWCRTCGGFFLDAGEGDALLALAARAEGVLRARGGASFAAPPADAGASVVDAYRREHGKSLFAEMIRGLFSGSARLRRRRRHDRHCRVDDALGSDWRW